MTKEEREELLTKLFEAFSNAKITTFLSTSKIDKLIENVFKEFDIVLSKKVYELHKLVNKK